MLRFNFKNTIKTLTRSPILWVMFLLVMGNIILFERMPLYSSTIDGELVFDTDPRYVLYFNSFIQMIPNYLSHSVMFYAAPAFAVITAMIVMANDYGKGFFEVEKAGGTRILTRLFGRFFALVVINSFVALAASFLAINYYYFSRGGVNGHNFWECFGFSTIRILRTFLFCELPAILVFLSLALVCGAILKNGYIASVIGLGYVVFNYAVSAYFGFRMSDFFNKYLTTNKFSAYLYFTYYDTEVAKTELIGMGIGHIPSPPSEVFAWSAIMFGIAFILICMTHFLTKKRSI
ncbi:MAG: hypothetical protein IJT36_01335 [Alphaproteobacteria bacterium]|nr:hypothetical protein [Alphaproteobacteria bacterium]